MAAWAEIGKAAWTVFKKYWPLALEAWRQVDKFVKDHPGLPDTVRRRLDAWRAGFADAQKKRTPEARVSATLDVIRRLADEAAGDEDISSVDAVDGAELRRRVDAVQRALEIVEAQAGDARRVMLRQVVKRADALAAEAFMSLIPDDAADGRSDESSPAVDSNREEPVGPAPA